MPKVTAVQKNLSQLKEILAQQHALHMAMGLMSWDLEVMMPAGGATGRSDILGSLSAQAHNKIADPVVDETLTALEAPRRFKALSAIDQALVKRARNQYHNAVLIPTELVQHKMALTSKAHKLWTEARKTSNFKLFAPILADIVAASRDMARCLAPTVADASHPYNMLLEQYEPGTTVAQLDTLFGQLSPRLAALVQRCAAKPVLSLKTSQFSKKSVSAAQQEQLCRELTAYIGFDYTSGRLDTAPHPFCMGLNAGDVRLTNRYLPDYWPSALFSALHEAGHGLYEQGMNPALHGTPLMDGASMGIHESQSRLWENLIGRSQPFWQDRFDWLQQALPGPMRGVSLDQWLQVINQVRPSLIRVEADEVTYNLHIILRYNVEKALIEGSLAVKDLPKFWKEQSHQLLGVVPQNDAEGCLQDIHWAHGSFGYFPTYTLGNLYSVQFLQAAWQAIPALKKRYTAKTLLQLKQWLNENIHWHAATVTPDALCRQVTGKPLDWQPFMAYLEVKYG